MNAFSNALTCIEKSGIIPEEHDLFGSLIGQWDFEWIDSHGTPCERHVKGEWIFSRVLEGTGVQDMFICPSRTERLINPQPDAEYGTTIRIYNPHTQDWDVFYGSAGEATRLTARKDGDKIVLTELTEQKMKWVFSDITEQSFHWERLESTNGINFKMVGELFAVRKT